jgi:Tfp pilus assembly protein FimT
MSSRRSNLAAFTLLELVLVLAVITVMVGMVLPRLSSFSRGRSVGNAANQIVALANWAHAQSVSRGVNFRLNIDPAKRSYWLTMQNGASYETMLQSQTALQNGPQSSNQTPTQYAQVGEDWGQSFVAPDGVNLACSVAPQPDGTYIEFRPNGRCDPGTVQLTDANGKVIEIGCLSATEEFHVLSDDERNQEKSLPQPAPSPQTR